MKWLFLFGAVYVILIAKAPAPCDLKTLQQCSPEEVETINLLNPKSKEDLFLLIQMEHSEKEIAKHRLLENLSDILEETERLKEKIEMLKQRHEIDFLKYDKKIKSIESEYRSDLIRRMLSERDKNGDTLTQSEMSDTSEYLISNQ